MRSLEFQAHHRKKIPRTSSRSQTFLEGLCSLSLLDFLPSVQTISKEDEVDCRLLFLKLIILSIRRLYIISKHYAVQGCFQFTCDPLLIHLAHPLTIVGHFHMKLITSESSSSYLASVRTARRNTYCFLLKCHSFLHFTTMDSLWQLLPPKWPPNTPINWIQIENFEFSMHHNMHRIIHFTNLNT